MASKYLSSLNKEDYDSLKQKLFKIQNKYCFICEKEIDLELQETDVDHIIPLVNKGKDTEENFALAHSSCNRSKQDSNLKLARILAKLTEIQETELKKGHTASLKHVLEYFGGSKFNFNFKIEENKLKYSFSDINENNLETTEIYIDKLSKEKFIFINVPIEYIFHDELINPRGINSSISKLIKEFDKGNPQLHLSLARIDNNKIKVFDGQHKAVAQLMLGVKKLILRIFIKPEIERLTETNTNAGSTLSQIAFDKSIMRQLNNTLYGEKIRIYQKDHNLPEDNYSFSEEDLVNHFKGDGINIKRYITDSIKQQLTDHSTNKLKIFIDREGKAKELPLSYSAYDKTFLTIFMDSKKILKTPLLYKDEQGLNPRELEINQLIQLMNIIAEEIYIDKFNQELGVFRIEKKIIDKKDKDITDAHLIAYRMSKEEIMYNWLKYIEQIIMTYFYTNGETAEKGSLFQKEFSDQLWLNIRNFIQNLRELPLWKDRNMASTIFSGKNPYDYWNNIFTTGKTSDNIIILAKPIRVIEMIRK